LILVFVFSAGSADERKEAAPARAVFFLFNSNKNLYLR
jgi:hypothetical protein